MHFHVITIFPNMFDSYLSESILARAVREKKIKISFYNPRDYVTGKYKKVWPDGNVSRIVDDRPYGGGPGMILRAEPVLKAVESALKKVQATSYKLQGNSKKPTAKSLQRTPRVKIVNFSPSGKKFTTEYSKTSVKKYTDIIMISGRYEGIDARVKKVLRAMGYMTDDVSIGDYVLTGGELPAMVLIDSISRQIPGVLGKFESLEEERVSSSEFYTRPEILEYKGKKHKVPKVLLSGDHKKIDEWKVSKKK
jgi:tRNA (guanine37-N1)-methyltransferase